MTISAAVVRELVAAGLSGEALVAALERIEAATVPTRTARQERNARYYQNKKAQAEADASELRRLKTLSDASGSPDKEVSPAPLQEINPSKENPPKGGQKKGSALPADWQPSDLDRAYGRNLGLTDAQIDRDAEQMRLWAQANAHRETGRKSNWSAAFKNWMLNNKNRAPPEKLTGRKIPAEGWL